MNIRPATLRPQSPREGTSAAGPSGGEVQHRLDVGVRESGAEREGRAQDHPAGDRGRQGGEGARPEIDARHDRAGPDAGELVEGLGRLPGELLVVLAQEPAGAREGLADIAAGRALEGGEPAEPDRVAQVPGIAVRRIGAGSQPERPAERLCLLAAGPRAAAAPTARGPAGCRRRRRRRLRSARASGRSLPGRRGCARSRCARQPSHARRPGPQSAAGRAPRPRPRSPGPGDRRPRRARTGARAAWRAAGRTPRRRPIPVEGRGRGAGPPDGSAGAGAAARGTRPGTRNRGRPTRTRAPDRPA